MLTAIKKWWQDDRGSGFSQMNTTLLEIVISVAAVTLILSGIFFSTQKLATRIGNQMQGVVS